MSLRDIIKRHGALYDLIRQAPGVAVKGIYQPAAEESATAIVAVIQPLSGRQIAQLPEGQSANDTRTVYTLFPLETRTPPHAPDQLIIRGERWRVYQVSEYEQLSGAPHFVALISRQKDGV